MTDLEISKALALAIGYLPEHVREYGVGSVNFEHGEGIIQVFRYDGVYGPERTDCAHLWNDFRYTSWNVIGPIAQKFDCFPMLSEHGPDAGKWFYFDIDNGDCFSAETPQKAIALAVIGAKKLTVKEQQYCIPPSEVKYTRTVIEPIDGAILNIGDKLYAAPQPAQPSEPAQPEQGEHGWLQSNSLLYRLTDERQPQNCDEINVTMAGGSRSDEARSAQATALLSMLQSAQPVAMPLPPPDKLNELADRIDHEQLWRWAGMDHDKMTPEQKDRMNAGVHLRRYASLLGGEYWRIYPPKPGLRYMADTLDEVIAMARKGGIGGKL